MPRHHNNNEITRGLALAHRSVGLFLFNIFTSSDNRNLLQHLLTALVSYRSKLLEKLTCRQLQKQTNGCHLKSTTCEFDGNRRVFVISWNQNKTPKHKATNNVWISYSRVMAVLEGNPMYRIIDLASKVGLKLLIDLFHPLHNRLIFRKAHFIILCWPSGDFLWR